MYHIFSDPFVCYGEDEYEEDIEEIFKILEEMLKQGRQNIRIYKQTEWDAEDGVFEDGDCIFSIGTFPM